MPIQRKDSLSIDGYLAILGVVADWLLGVARNKAFEITRRRRPELLNDEVCETIEDTADDPERAIQKKQNGWILFACLKNLSPVHREIINLI